MGPEIVTVNTYADEEGTTPVTLTRVSLGTMPALSPWDAATLARQLGAVAAEAGLAAGLWAPCRYCPAPVLWARSEKGGAVPLDLGDTADGILALRSERGQPLVRWLKAGEAPRAGERRVTSHFATCPGAPQARADAKAKGGGRRDSGPVHAR